MTRELCRRTDGMGKAGDGGGRFRAARGATTLMSSASLLCKWATHFDLQNKAKIKEFPILQAV